MAMNHGRIDQIDFAIQGVVLGFVLVWSALPASPGVTYFGWRAVVSMAHPFGVVDLL
jgi:hypothetical protein